MRLRISGGSLRSGEDFWLRFHLRTEKAELVSGSLTRWDAGDGNDGSLTIRIVLSLLPACPRAGCVGADACAVWPPSLLSRKGGRRCHRAGWAMVKEDRLN
jgi:hypothetical protein